MIRFFAVAILFLTVFSSSAKEMKDTVKTPQNDLIILSYNVSSDNDRLTVDFSRPRIIPSASLKQACKGEFDKLKVVLFDRVGDYGKVKWNGMSPSAFMIPGGLAYDKSAEGYYILGESPAIEFRQTSANKTTVNLPLFIAVYDKKNTYRLLAAGKHPLRVSSAPQTSKTIQRTGSRQETVTERIAVTSSMELEADNRDITSALSSMEMVRELLTTETEVPFSQTLQMEIHNLMTLKNQIREPEVVGRINDVLKMCNDKERQLKEERNQSDLAAKAEEQALLQAQKKEAEDQQKEAEKKAKEQEEKQQKRTLWMIIGGVILAILGFIGNAVFKHFRDIRNQKSLMEMQESLARQAEHEASRRSREIVRNKAHQAVNKGRNKVRSSMNGNGSAKKDATSPKPKIVSSDSRTNSTTNRPATSNKPKNTQRRSI